MLRHISLNNRLAWRGLHKFCRNKNLQKITGSPGRAWRPLAFEWAATGPSQTVKKFKSKMNHNAKYLTINAKLEFHNSINPLNSYLLCRMSSTRGE